MATSKKTASKKTTSKKRTTSRSGGGVLQIDEGWYSMYQNGDEVGQIVVINQTGGSVEYYFLYKSGTGSGQAPYTWPGPKTCPVTTKLDYDGSLPPGWSTPAKYQSSLYPIVATLVTATCVVSQSKTGRKAKR